MLKFWRVRTCASWRARGQGLSVCCLMTWSLWVLNWVNLWWMDMKISMITWKHKMAPGWRPLLSDHTEKLRLSIPDNDKDTVKNLTWLLILFLRYHGPKICTRTGTRIVSMLPYDVKFMGIELGEFMMNGYEDINDNVKTQNGTWMTSLLSDHTEKLRLSIPDNDKDTVKNLTWLLILFLRYHGPKICTEFFEKLFIQKQFLTRGNLSCWQIKVICFWHLSHLESIIWPRSRHLIQNWRRRCR